MKTDLIAARQAENELRVNYNMPKYAVHISDAIDELGRLRSINAELLAALQETRDATAMILQICVGLGFANKIVDELGDNYEGFGKRADDAIKNATAMHHGLCIKYHNDPLFIETKP